MQHKPEHGSARPAAPPLPKLPTGNTALKDDPSAEAMKPHRPHRADNPAKRHSPNCSKPAAGTSSLSLETGSTLPERKAGFNHGALDRCGFNQKPVQPETKDRRQQLHSR